MRPGVIQRFDMPETIFLDVIKMGIEDQQLDKIGCLKIMLMMMLNILIQTGIELNRLKKQ